MCILFSGSSHPTLARKTVKLCRAAWGAVQLGCFPDGEIRIEVKSDVHDACVFVLQSASSWKAIGELLLIIDALKRCHPRSLIILLPYFGYSRQDRCTDQGPVSAQVVARLLNHSGADGLVTVDLHSKAVAHFIAIPHTEMYTSYLFADYIHSQISPDECIVIVSPDEGGSDRARQLCQALSTETSLLVLNKNRSSAEQCQINGPEIDLTDVKAIVVDDIASTGGTLVRTSRWLVDRGVDSIWACVTHLIDSDRLIPKLTDSPIEKLIVSDSLPRSEPSPCSAIETVSLAPLLAGVISALYPSDDKSIYEGSVSVCLPSEWNKLSSCYVTEPR